MSSSSPILYLIRHGEKPPKVDGKDPDGLSDLGKSRARQLVKVFGPDSGYDIGCILAQHPKLDGKEDRPYRTVKPLADFLGVPFNTEIDRDDKIDVAKAVKHYIKHYTGEGNILICWEHHQLNDIALAIIQAEDLGSPGPGVLPEYPDDRFDIIWPMSMPYDKIDTKLSEHCTQDEAYRGDPGYYYPR